MTRRQAVIRSTEVHSSRRHLIHTTSTADCAVPGWDSGGVLGRLKEGQRGTWRRESTMGREEAGA